MPNGDYIFDYEYFTIMAQCKTCVRLAKCRRIDVNEYIINAINKCTVEQLETGGACYDHYHITINLRSIRFR